MGRDPFQMYRRALRPFAQNSYVALRLVAGELDHVLDPQARKAMDKKRIADPQAVVEARKSLKFIKAEVEEEMILRKQLREARKARRESHEAKTS